MHCIIIIFLIKYFWRKANVAVTGLLLLPVTKEDCKMFCPMSRIHAVTARPAPQR